MSEGGSNLQGAADEKCFSLAYFSGTYVIGRKDSIEILKSVARPEKSSARIILV